MGSLNDIRWTNEHMVYRDRQFWIYAVISNWDHLEVVKMDGTEKGAPTQKISEHTFVGQARQALDAYAEKHNLTRMPQLARLMAGRVA